jgi:hypothetical protein
VAQRSKPRPGPAGLLRLGVIGDSGSGAPAQLRVASQLAAWNRLNPLKFVLMLGDNVYEKGEAKYFDSKFIDVYRSLFDAGVGFHATLGNHDLRYQDGREQLQHEAFGYIDGQDEYELPAGPLLDNGKQLARFICLNSNRWVAAVQDNDARALESLRTALRERLARADQYHWNVVYFHHAMHSFIKGGLFKALHGHGSTKELQIALQPELRGLADLVLNGHDHFYQKIKPVEGVHYIVSGAAGKLRKGVSRTHDQVEHGAGDYHFVDLNISAEWLRYQAIDDNGGLIHSGEIRKAGAGVVDLAA